MRHKHSDYMHWAKTESRARFNLATSGVGAFPLRELRFDYQKLEINGDNSYGYAPLQCAIARQYGADPDCVVEAPGTSMANHLAMAALIEPGDEVLIEHPAYGLLVDGCTLVGGHSGEAGEAALGFAVTGLAEAETLTRKSGLRPGDALILTRPIGTGIVLAGHMRGLTRASWLSATIESMRRSNAAAARVLRDHAVTACTDITGFGLAGHLAEMARASGVAATIFRGSVPVLPGTLELAAQGVESSLAPENARVVPNLSTEPRERVLIDPQTSGGLLGGVPSEQAEACLRALIAAGMRAAIVGVVEPISPDAPMIRIAEERPRV